VTPTGSASCRDWRRGDESGGLATAVQTSTSS